MDPDTCLNEIREWSRKIQRDLNNGNSPDADDVSVLLEHLFALDQWIKNGGFLPTDWERKP